MLIDWANMSEFPDKEDFWCKWWQPRLYNGSWMTTSIGPIGTSFIAFSIILFKDFIFYIKWIS